MNDQTREYISTLMDGEISRETGRFLVRRLGSDEELCETWARYHLVRDCLRHQDGGLSSDDLCSRVNRALRDEPQKSVRRFPVRWLKPAVGAAIAASVTLMAVLAVDSGAPGATPLPQGVADASAVEPFTSPQGLSGPAGITQQASMAGSPRMNSYLLRHYQAAGPSSGKGIVFFVPVVSRSGQASTTETEAENGEPANGRDEQETQ